MVVYRRIINIERGAGGYLITETIQLPPVETVPYPRVMDVETLSALLDYLHLLEMDAVTYTVSFGMTLGRLHERLRYRKLHYEFILPVVAVAESHLPKPRYATTISFNVRINGVPQLVECPNYAINDTWARLMNKEFTGTIKVEGEDSPYATASISSDYVAIGRAVFMAPTGAVFRYYIMQVLKEPGSESLRTLLFKYLKGSIYGPLRLTIRYTTRKIPSFGCVNWAKMPIKVANNVPTVN